MISLERQKEMELAGDLLWLEFKGRCRRTERPTSETCYEFLRTCGYGEAVSVCASEDFLAVFC